MKVATNWESLSSGYLKTFQRIQRHLYFRWNHFRFSKFCIYSLIKLLCLKARPPLWWLLFNHLEQSLNSIKHCKIWLNSRPWSQKAGYRVPSLTSCVTMGKLLNPSGYKKGQSNSTLTSLMVMRIKRS